MKFNMLLKMESLKSVICILSAIAILSGCYGNPDNRNGNGAEVYTPSVDAVQAEYGSLPLIERLNGVVKAKNQVEIFPRSAP